MKRIAALILIFAMLFTNAYAAVLEVNVGGVSVNSLKDGAVNTITLEEAPYINESGRTMVPIRAITESFGAEVSWNGETREVTIKNGENSIVLTIDKSTAVVDGNEMAMDSAPEIKGGRTFVPLRFIGEALGYNLNYVASTKQIIIDDSKIAFKYGDATFTLAEIEAFYDIYYQASRDKAAASGATEEQIKTSALYAALELGINYTVVKGVFPEAGLNEDHISVILQSIEQDKAYLDIPLDGISALCHEKLYYSNGAPALYKIAESEEVRKPIEENYVRAKHILVDDEETAHAVLAKIAAGYDFDELVKEYGKDPGMEANKDGYVFSYGEMVKPFEEASFALGVGEISAPVKSDFGYHIIKREALGEIPTDVALSLASQILNEKLGNAEYPEVLVTEEEMVSIIK